MDNATFHKGGRISQLIEGTGCQLLYLPLYSPDLNKIEQCWSRLKSRIRKQLDRFNCLRSGDRGCLASCIRRRRARLLYVTKHTRLGVLFVKKHVKYYKYKLQNIKVLI